MNESSYFFWELLSVLTYDNKKQAQILENWEPQWLMNELKWDEKKNIILYLNSVMGCAETWYDEFDVFDDYDGYWTEDKGQPPTLLDEIQYVSRQVYTVVEEGIAFNIQEHPKWHELEIIANKILTLTEMPVIPDVEYLEYEAFNEIGINDAGDFLYIN